MLRYSTDRVNCFGGHMPLEPGVKLLLDQVAQAGGPSIREAGVQQGRQMLYAMALLDGEPAEVARVEDVTIAGNIPARVYAASTGNALPIVVWYHGGGFVAGDLETADRTCRTLAIGTGALI